MSDAEPDIPELRPAEKIYARIRFMSHHKDVAHLKVGRIYLGREEFAAVQEDLKQRAGNTWEFIEVNRPSYLKVEYDFWTPLQAAQDQVRWKEAALTNARLELERLLEFIRTEKEKEHREQPL